MGGAQGAESRRAGPELSDPRHPRRRRIIDPSKSLAWLRFPFPPGADLVPLGNLG